MLVSKEINVLENEMLEFKDSLAEWKSMPSLLHIEESTSAAGNCAIFLQSYVLFMRFQIVAATFVRLWLTFVSSTPTKCKRFTRKLKAQLNMYRPCQDATLSLRWTVSWH